MAEGEVCGEGLEGRIAAMIIWRENLCRSTMKRETQVWVKAVQELDLFRISYGNLTSSNCLHGMAPCLDHIDTYCNASNLVGRKKLFYAAIVRREKHPKSNPHKVHRNQDGKIGFNQDKTQDRVERNGKQGQETFF